MIFRRTNFLYFSNLSNSLRIGRSDVGINKCFSVKSTDSSKYSVFSKKHLGIKDSDKKDMLQVTNSVSIKGLIKKTVNLPNFKEASLCKLYKPYTETESQEKLKSMMDMNKSHTSLIGLGYHNTITPYPIKRHVLENSKWYTAYTPYQAEISQGRLEAQYNFQTVIQELTGLPLSNASLLDESSTAAEVLNMCYHYKNKDKKKTFLVDSKLHPQINEVLKTKANILGVNLVFEDLSNWTNNENNKLVYDDVFGIMFSYPNTHGEISVPQKLIDIFAKKDDVTICANADILSLFVLEPPVNFNVDICFGTAQRLGIPMYFGGPHPAFLSVDKKYTRLMPGRIIGKSVDTLGKECYRLGLQTREQHIRKDKATSNICTSQSLLANMVGFYVSYLGKKSIQQIALETHAKTQTVDYFCQKYGLYNINNNYFDTLHFKSKSLYLILTKLLEKDFVVRKISRNEFTMSFDETISLKQLYQICNLITYDNSINYYDVINKYDEILDELVNINTSKFQPYQRISNNFLQGNKFEYGMTETEFVRYLHYLTKKDFTLTDGMIPLGSCTMKLNSVFELEALSWPSVQQFHPYTPIKYVRGYHKLFDELGSFLKDITGFDNISFQSNSGAMGEYSGLLCIKKYHEERGNMRNVCLIPKSAHGTNFASAHLAGYQVLSYDDNLNMTEFKGLVSSISEKLSCLMITYPGTNGIFQDNIKEITECIHYYGGLVYFDGANMNALVGLVKPEEVGADVCHLNLHKTFCIPHGGGGPGMGPILCNNKLGKYLPNNIFQSDNYWNNKHSIGMITGSNWSSASLLTIPYQYILASGEDGLRKHTEISILNANYLKDKLKNYYQIVDINKNDRVAHEFIIDVSNLKNIGITELDIAKRLMDYSFHPPTMSWPRLGVLMFEPTETENKAELERLVEALISINKEILDISKTQNYENNILKNSPHSIDLITNWPHKYSMEQAFFPVSKLKENKFWPTNTRIDDIQGDKMLLKK